MIKSFITACVTPFGYEFCRIKDQRNSNVNSINVLKYLVPKDNVSFVQIGANDGKQCDPINPLINETWRGIFVEPNTFSYRLLAKTYSYLPSVIFESIAIHQTAKSLKLYVSNDSLCDSIHKKTSVFKVVPAISLQELFKRHNVTNLDLFVTDTEGCDYDIMHELLYKTGVKPKLIQFEHFFFSRAKYRAICDKLLLEGYKLLQVGIDTVAQLG
jgi:FkbM family methyltransferase